jgi:uncharacterized protein (TIGR02266 family)
MALCHRRHPRLPFRVPIEYRDFERFNPDATLNVSADGLFILTPNPFPVGRRFALRFDIPGLKLSINVWGRVVWAADPENYTPARRHPTGMAIEFENLDPDLRAVLDQFVTVSLGLASIDPRIGRELPPRLQRELPQPDTETTVPSLELDLLVPPDYP